MTKEELLEVNKIFVVVDNPMDAITHLTLKLTGVPRNRVIGMGGLLDSSRFKYYLNLALGLNYKDVHGIVIGGHEDL